MSGLLVEAFAAKWHVHVGTANVDVLARALLLCTGGVFEGERRVSTTDLADGAEVLDLLGQGHEFGYGWPGLLAAVAVQR